MNLLAVILASWAASYFCYQCGRKEGKEEGYRAGMVEAHKWWIAMEDEVDQARQIIWRENS